MMLKRSFLVFIMIFVSLNFACESNELLEDAEKVQEQNAKEEFSKVFKVWNQYIFNQNINSVKESDSNKKSFLITRDYSIRFLSKKGFSVNELNQFSNEQLFLKAIDEHSK